MNTEIALLQCSAAVAYGLGGACMKLSDGLRRPPATAGVYALFLLGATLQALSLRRSDLGVPYVLVLGLEALVALGIALFAFGESITLPRALGVVLILTGALLLS
jgi:multidrug transporter EmrE-like cation transporter